MLRDGVFAPLRDPAAFAQARVHPELGAVVWPGGADLDPDVLYAALTGTEIALLGVHNGPIVRPGPRPPARSASRGLT